MGILLCKDDYKVKYDDLKKVTKKKEGILQNTINKQINKMSNLQLKNSELIIEYEKIIKNHIIDIQTLKQGKLNIINTLQQELIGKTKKIINLKKQVCSQN
jgi:hypothetical protein|tara:strand:+ start:2255 stop:2557 length:303 start_codon:yes stop_codon:yes gene_type:complete